MGENNGDSRSSAYRLPLARRFININWHKLVCTTQQLNVEQRYNFEIMTFLDTKYSPILYASTIT